MGAIYRESDSGPLNVDYSLCIGCRTCVSVCPFGAMNYNAADRKVFKCDHCGGDPQCVRFCEEKAVDFVSPDKLDQARRRQAAKRLLAG
jgi:Fe-S-cluster-containing hydrogenase component 2